MAPDAMGQAALDATNKLRARYGAKPLKWDDNLYAQAYAWAQQLASRDYRLDHDNVTGQSENLAVAWGSTKYNDVGTFAVRQWWAPRMNDKGEEYFYFYEPRRGFFDWGHFAIMLGKAQHSMGIAAVQTAQPIRMAPSTGRGWYIVARYVGSSNLQNKEYTTMPPADTKAYMMQPGYEYPTEELGSGPPMLPRNGYAHDIDGEPGVMEEVVHYTGGIGFDIRNTVRTWMSHQVNVSTYEYGWAEFAQVNHCHCENEGKGCPIPTRSFELPHPQTGTLIMYTPTGNDGYVSSYVYKGGLWENAVRNEYSDGWAAFVKKWRLCCDPK